MRVRCDQRRRRADGVAASASYGPNVAAICTYAEPSLRVGSQAA